MRVGEAEYREPLVERIDTSGLTQSGKMTRALVVINPTMEAGRCRVRFAATFPIRRSMGPQPVTMRDGEGTVVPSRLTRNVLVESDTLPPERVLWDMELEFIVAEMAPRSWETFSAVFGRLDDAPAEPEVFAAVPLRLCPVLETECHPGTLPLTGPVDALQ